MLTTRILITKGISSQATAAPPSDIVPRQMNPLDSASTALPADRKPVITPSRARPLTSPHHLAAYSSSSRVSPKALAVGRSTPKTTDSSKDKCSKLTVIVYDYKFNSVHIQALRSDRIADVLQRYAETKGLNFDSLSVSRSSKSLALNTRLGTIVKRHLNVYSLNVDDADNLPDANPYSDYDSDT